MPYYENKEAHLYYEEYGQGNPLVFLHGAMLDMGQWKKQVEHFSSKYRVITLDARGHGKSTLPPGEVPPDIFWQDVIAMLNHLDIPKATICGLSMGGHVALQTAINAQERVNGLILIGTPFTNRFNSYERLVVPINRFCQRLMPMSLIAWSISTTLGGSKPEEKTYIRDVVGSIRHDVYNRCWKAVTSMESRCKLVDITCPTIILIGEHDWMTRRQQQYMNNEISCSRLVTIENAGHATTFDNPTQVEKEIEAFLSKFVN